MGISAVTAIRPQHFLQPRSKLFLKVHGVILAHIHGFNLNIHLLGQEFSLPAFPCRFLFSIVKRFIQRLLLPLKGFLGAVILLFRTFYVFRISFFRIFIKTMIICLLL